MALKSRKAMNIANYSKASFYMTYYIMAENSRTIPATQAS
jgi:hypothetical protein